MIAIGGKRPSGIKLGEKDISKIFLGEVEVWPNNKVTTYEYTFNVADISFPATGGTANLKDNIVSTRQKFVNGEPEGVSEDVPYTVEVLSISPIMRFDEDTLDFEVSNNEIEGSVYAGFRITQSESRKAEDINVVVAPGKRVYDSPFINTFYYDERDAAGGTLTPKLTYSQNWTWNDVEGSGGTITSGAAINAAIRTAVEGASVNPSTGIVTWEANTGEAREVTVDVSITLNGYKSDTKSAVAKQNADAIDHYSDMVINSFTVSDIPASGGEISSGTVDYIQKVHYISGKITDITSGAVIEYSAPIKANTLGTTEKPRTNLGKLTIAVSLNDKSTTKDVDVFQEENAVTSYGDLVGGSVNVRDIPAGGGSIDFADLDYVTPPTQIITYTSKATENAVITQSVPDGVSGENLGETIKPRTKLAERSVVCKGRGNKEKAIAFDVYQEANVAIYGDVVITGGEAADIPAGGGVVTTDDITGYSSSQAVSFTSGATRAGVTTNALSGEVSAPNLGTEQKPRSSIGLIAITATGEGGKTKTKDIFVYQAANEVVYSELNGGSVSVSDIPASGGKASDYDTIINPTQTASYTSGATRDCVVASEITSNEITAESLGTTVKSRTNLGTFEVLFRGEGNKTKAASLTVFQQANTAVYGELFGGDINLSDIPASGGDATLMIIGMMQKVSFTSGSTRSGVVSHSVDKTVSAPSLGSTVKERTLIDTINVKFTGEGGKTHTETLSAYQAANEITYSELQGGSISVVDAPANGDKLTASVTNATQTVSFTSGSNRAGTVTFTAPTYGGVNLDTTIKNRTSIGDVSVKFIGEGGKTSTKSVTAYQEANLASYSELTGGGLTADDIPASGGKAVINIAVASQTVSFTSGSTRAGSITNSIVNAVSAPSLGTTVKNRTLIDTASVLYTGEGGKTMSKSVDVYQSLNAITEYGNLTGGSMVAADIPAAGGSVTPTIEANPTQIITYSSGATRLGNITSETPEPVSAPGLGTTIKSRTSIDSRTVKFTGENSKVTHITVAVYQAANVATDGNVTLTGSYGNVTASGGTSAANASATQGISYTSGATSSRPVTNISYAIKTPVVGASITTGGTVTWTNNTSTSARSVTVVITATGSSSKTAVKEVACSQSAGVQVFNTPIINSYSYDERDAAGGTLTPKISYSQAWTWNGVASTGGTIISGGTISASITVATTGASVNASTGVVTWAANTGAAREVTVSITVTMNGKASAPKTAIAKQNADSISRYGDMVINSFSVGDIPASGGSASSGTVSYKQTVYYVSGRTTNITSGATISYSSAVSKPSLGTTVKSRTSAGTLTVTVSLNGKSASSSVTVYQAANSVTYSNPTVNASYGDISAGGSTVTPSMSYSQTASYTSGSSTTITSGGSVSYSGTGVNTSNGSVSASSLGTTVKSRTKITAATVSVSLNGKSNSRTVDVYQTANSVSYSNPTVSLSYGDISAGGSTVSPNLSYSQTASYTSGSSLNITSGGSVSYSGTSVNTSNGTVSAKSLGTTVKSRTQITTATTTVIVNGKTGTKTAGVYQAANAITSYGTPSVNLSYGNIGAGGGTVNPSLSYGQTVNYTSGSTTTLTSGGSISYKGASNNSTGAVSAGSKGTSTSSTTTVATVTATVTMNGKSGSKSATVYQNGNSITSYGTPSISMSYSDISAGGGSVTPSVSFTQRVSYSSGSSSTVSSGGTRSYSGSGVNTSTGSVSASNLGTTTKSRTKITTSTVSITVNGRTGTRAVDVYQSANSITSYGNVSISNGSVADIPASGGTVSSVSGLSYSQTVSYSSGGSRSGSVSISYSSAIKASSLGTTVKSRSAIGTLNAKATGEGGKSNNKDFTVYQAANAITKTTTGSWSITISADKSTIPGIGGTATISASAIAPRTNHYTSGSTSAAANSVASPALSGSATGFTLSGPTVTAVENPNAASRSIVITASYSGVSKSLTIIQSASSITWRNELTATPSTLSFGAIGGTKTVSIVSRREKQLNGKNTGVYESVPWTIS